jgi:hypothetical protein
VALGEGCVRGPAPLINERNASDETAFLQLGNVEEFAVIRTLIRNGAKGAPNLSAYEPSTRD